MADLEASNRRLRRGVAAAAMAALLPVAVGLAPTQRTIDATSVVVRDGAGRARLQLAVTDDVPALSVFDAEGVLRAALAIEREGPILNLFSPSGQPRAILAERETRAHLILRDSEGVPRAAMAVQESGDPSLYLLDAELTPIWRQPAR